MAKTDLNADGYIDIALVTSNAVVVSLGTGSSFAAQTSYPVNSPFSVTFADYNNDSNPDLAISHDVNSVSIRLGSGSGTFGSPTTFTVGSFPMDLASCDVDGDGNNDIITANAGSNDISVLIGNGAGGFGPATSYTVGAFPWSLCVGDFNEDGKPDLATSNSNS